MSRTVGDEGFTLVEVILVIIILGILMAVAVPKFINLMDETVDDNRCAAARGAINSALSVTYGSILVSDPTQESWLDDVTFADLADSMFATGQIPFCPRHGTLAIVNGQAICSIHGQ